MTLSYCLLKSLKSSCRISRQECLFYVELIYICELLNIIKLGFYFVFYLNFWLIFNRVFCFGANKCRN